MLGNANGVCLRKVSRKANNLADVIAKLTRVGMVSRDWSVNLTGRIWDVIRSEENH